MRSLKRMLQPARARLREFFWLEQSERQSLLLSADLRAAARAHVEAAQRRRQVAQNLTDPDQQPVALSLYRECSRLLALAYLVAQGEEVDPALAPDALLRRLDAALQSHGVLPPAGLARVTPLLVAADPLQPDRLPRAEANAQIDDLDRTTGFLLSLLELRSPREIKTARRVRQGAGAAVALLLVVILGGSALAPRNLARDQPAVASSVMLETTAGGAVDGSKSGKFGFHSSLEDSPWLSIDLGKPHAIDRINVFGRADEHNGQSIPLALEASDDGTTYRQVALRTEPFSADAPWVITQAFVTRFVRLRTQRRSYLVLSEVEVFGKPH